MDPAALFRRHHDDLRRYLIRLTGDPELAADASQEAFVRLTDRPPERDDNLRSWLFRVGTNLVRDAARRRSRRDRILTENPGRVPAPTSPAGPAATAEARMLRRRVRDALDQLSMRDRTVLLMREEGFKHREIAEAVGTTTKSVGTLIARALDRLARELDLDREKAV